MIAIAPLMLCLASPPGPTADVPLVVARVDRPRGPDCGGLRSRIWLERPGGPGDPLLVHYELENVSDEDRTAWHSGFWPNHRIDVTGPDGDLAPLTPHGRHVRDAYDPEGPRRKHFGRTLKPGEVDDTLGGPYDLRGLYDLSAPGTYRVRYRYREGRMEPVRSNVLEVRVD